MRINGNIWESLGSLAVFVDIIEHDEGVVHFKDDAPADKIAEIHAAIAAHGAAPIMGLERPTELADPTEKLIAFLRANQDVAALLK